MPALVLPKQMSQAEVIEFPQATDLEEAEGL
jgi:hypothetical protein